MGAETSWMWVERLDIRGFRRLEGVYEFSPHLSVIDGGNEAGKSSMHDAVTRTLFGFSKSERRRRAGDSVQTRCAPWNGNPFAINAVVHRSERRYSIEWDFAEHRVTLRDLVSGEDLSARVGGHGDDVTLGSFLLQLGLDDFRHACCLDQAKIAAVMHSESLVGALQRAVERGATDSGVEEASERLNDFLRNEIGVRVDTLQPNPKGRMRALEARAEELAQLLTVADQAREEIAGLEQQRQGLVDERERADIDLLIVEQAILRQEDEVLSSRFERARQHQQRASIETPAGSLPDEQQEAEVNALVAEDGRLREEIAGLVPQTETAENSTAGLEQQRASIQAERDGLETYARVDTSSEEAVRDLLGRRAELSQPVKPPATEQGAPAPGRTTAPLWAASAIVALASIAAAAVVGVPALAGLLVAAVLAYLARQRGRITVRARGVDPAAIASRQREIDGELSAALDHVGAAALADLSQRAQAYLTACAYHARRLELAARLGELQAELTAARRPLVETERRRARLAEISEQLMTRFSELGIDSSDRAQAQAEWQRRSRQAKEFRKQEAAATEAKEGYRTALGKLTLDQLKGARDQAATDLREHLVRFGELQPLDLDKERLAARRAELAKQSGDLALRITELETRMSDREGRLPDVPALREEAEALAEQITNLHEVAPAVALARDALEESAHEAHRAFRPHLERALKRNLARLTDGRYTEVSIDDELAITIVAPETGRMIAAEELSRGTQDQIFFVERLEMIDLLDPTTGESPLLLDEPFVHFDDKRLAVALELLAEEADERQVMFFTTDPRLAAQAAGVRDDARLVSLQAPGKSG